MTKSIKAKLLLTLSICFILLFFIPTDATAGAFDPTPQDKSVEYLGMVFGGSIGSLHLGTSQDSNVFLGNLFQVFNGIILAVAIFVLSYTSAVSVLNTAHEGEIMGKKWSSVWIPLRSSIGLLLLAPIPGSGYSLIQVTVMWVVLNGIGAADRIWSLVVDNLSQGISVTQNTQIEDTSSAQLQANAKAIAPGILQSLVCMALIDRYSSPEFQAIGPQPTPTFTTPTLTGGANPIMTGSLQFGSNDSGNPTRQTICGSVPIVASVSTSEIVDNNGQQIILTIPQQQQLVKNAYEIKKQALNAMITYIKPIAADIAQLTPDDNGNIIFPTSYNLDPKNIDPNQPGLLGGTILSYQSTMSNLSINEMALGVGGSFNKMSNQQQIDDSKKYGWMLAGAYYYNFSANQRTQNLLSTARNDEPKKVNCPLIGQTNGIDSQSSSNLDNALFGKSVNAGTFNPYSKALSSGSLTGLFTIPQPVGAGSSFDMTGDRAIYALLVVNPGMMIPLIVFNETAKSVIPSLFSGNGDPLLNIARVGVQFMTAAEILWISIMTISLGLTAVSAICSASNPMGFAMLGALISMFPMALALAGIMWFLGATMSIYIPMVPYMIFAVTALGWFISVIESIVAAPIVALGLIMPSQEEIGAIKPALGMIAGIFLRPMLTIIGLILAAKLFKTTMIMINTGFQTSLANLTGQSGKSIFAWIGMLTLYVGFITALVNKCYSLIHHLPDKILKWIGAGEDNTDISAVGESKKTFESGSKTGIASVESGAESGAKSLESKANSYNKNSGGDGSGLNDKPGGGGDGAKKPGGGDKKSSSGDGSGLKDSAANSGNASEGAIDSAKPQLGGSQATQAPGGASPNPPGGAPGSPPAAG